MNIHPKGLSALALSVLLLLSGCMSLSPWRSHERPWTSDTVSGARQVRATRTNGEQVVLVEAYLDDDALRLHGTLIDSEPVEKASIPIDTLTSLETRRFETRRLLGNLGIGAGSTVLLVIIIVGTFGYVAALA